MTSRITAIHAEEVLDSRGRLTLAVSLHLASGAPGNDAVPSGASTGSREAVELRDGDERRYGGAGVLRAARNVNGEIADAIVGQDFHALADLDAALIDLDGPTTSAAWAPTPSSGYPWPPPAPTPPTMTSRCIGSSPPIASSRGCRCRASTSSTAAATPPIGCSPRSS